MNPSEIDFIKKQMKKSGFQLEDKVASLFSEFKNCEVEQNYCFTDWQTGLFRELDMKVDFEVTSYPIEVNYKFLIECKRLTGHAWVLIRNRGHSFVFKNATSMWDNYGQLGRQEPVSKILNPIFKYEFICDTYSKRFKEIILDRSKSNNKTDNIFSSSIELAKVLDFEQRSDFKVNEMLVTSSERRIDRINIYYPLIVFEGKMFEATMLPNLEIKPISSAHLRHSSIQNGEEILMLIDIVEANNLKEFIKEKFLKEVDQVRKNVAEVRDSYLSLIDRLKHTRRISLNGLK
jgi:hypothetical protein